MTATAGSQMLTLTEADPWKNEIEWISISERNRCSWMRENCGRFFKTIEELRTAKVSVNPDLWSGDSGVYFLFLSDELQYVGKAGSFYSRLYQHLLPDRPSLNRATWFDSVALLDTPPEFAEEIEGHYISALNPPRNTKPGRPCRWKP